MNLTGKQILKLYLKIGKPFSIRLNGQSMQPVLWSGDLIQISPNRVYEQGDIILFSYKEEGELAHRIILITDLACYCKGDNAFRIEEVPFDCIYGKVTGRYDEEGFHSCCFRFHIAKYIVCYFSNKVGQQCLKNKWDISSVQKKIPYRFLQWFLPQIASSNWTPRSRK